MRGAARHGRAPSLYLARVDGYTAAMRYLIFAATLAAGCAGFGEADERALVVAQANADLTRAQAADFRGYILAADARQRAALERELALIVELELRDVSKIDAESRPVVTVAEARGVLEKIAAKRAEIYAQLDRERETWLADPKLRAQERNADLLTAYAQARSEMVRFIKGLTDAE